MADWGNLAGGFAKGLQSGSELGLRIQESKLKSKMLQHQMDVQDFEQQEKVRKAGEERQQAQELGRFVDLATKGVPQQVTPGFESEAQQMSVAPVESNFRPANPQELLGQGLKSVPAANRASLIQQSMKPTAATQQRAYSIGPGGALVDVTGKQLYQNPAERQGVGVESQTWSRIIKENPGADLTT